LVASAHHKLRSGSSDAAIAEFEQALRLWRGQPLVDLADHEATMPQVVELSELRTGAVEGRLQALVETGRHVEAIPGLESLIAESPLRDTPYELLMLALHRAGRSAEALAMHRRYRDLIRAELGIDPGARLENLESAILNRDPRLEPPPSSNLVERAVPSDAREHSVTALLTELIATLHAVSERTAMVAELLMGQPAYATGPRGGERDLASLVEARDSSYTAPGPAEPVESMRSWGGAGRPNVVRIPAASEASLSAS